VSEYTADYDARLAKVEAQIDALTRALHLLTVAHKPTSEWLDKTMADIDETYAILPEMGQPW